MHSKKRSKKATINLTILPDQKKHVQSATAAAAGVVFCFFYIAIAIQACISFQFFVYFITFDETFVQVARTRVHQCDNGTHKSEGKTMQKHMYRVYDTYRAKSE